MPQRIYDVMTPKPVALPGTASVHEAACAMRDRDIGDVMVIEPNQVCGIVKGTQWTTKNDSNSPKSTGERPHS